MGTQELGGLGDAYSVEVLDEARLVEVVAFCLVVCRVIALTTRARRLTASLSGCSRGICPHDGAPGAPACSPGAGGALCEEGDAGDSGARGGAAARGARQVRYASNEAGANAHSNSVFELAPSAWANEAAYRTGSPSNCA